jgi:shikimate dehydrogenase
MNDSPIPRACVTGQPIAQSRSPMLHGYWLRQQGVAGSYGREELSPEQAEGFFRNLKAHGYVGCNVTAPNKLAALRSVARADAAATAIGAVNTIWYEDGELVGSNTDAHGFIANLDDRAPGWDAGATRAVILGAGGATRAAIFALRQRGLAITLVNRTRAHADDLAAHFNAFPGPKVDVVNWCDLASVLGDADLLVNTTVLGMLGKPAMEIDITGLKPSATVYDIVYVPLETGLLKQARAMGHRGVDGLGMLLHQGIPGFKRWFGGEPVVTPELRRLIEDDIRSTTPGA